MHASINRTSTVLSAAAVCTLLSAMPTGAVEAAEQVLESGRNKATLFVGGTFEGSEESAVALGIEYERRLNQSFGVGATVEYSFGKLDSLVVVVPLVYHTGRWAFWAGPGIKRADHENEFLVRVGGEYGFEIGGGWELAPQVNVDYAAGWAWVVGVGLGRKF